jgi:hypothetical protein
MSNLPPGVTLADIDRHFGPPRCALDDCETVAEDFHCAVCQDPLCNRHAPDGVSSCCPYCQRQVEEAMDEFSFLRLEQMLRNQRRQARWHADNPGFGAEYRRAHEGQAELLGGIINTLTEIRSSEHDDGL